MAGYGAQTLLRFISRIILTKLLINPAPMGTVAVITTILAGLEMISDLGINLNIVQHRDGDSARFIGTARSVQLLRSVLLFLVAVAMAWPVAWLYHDPELGPLLLFGALSVLVRGFNNPGLSLHVRNVDLMRPTLVGIVSEAAGFVVTVIWAFKAPSAWAIVGGSVASAITVTVASQIAAKPVAFAWDGAIARNIIKFGGWIILSTGTWFLASRGETLLLKGSVPDVEFGCFAFASMLVAAPFAAITQLGAQVLMPLLASWGRDSEEAIRTQFRRVKWMFTALGICVAWGAILVSPFIIHLLHFNRSFSALTWMVQILGVRAALDVFGLPVSNGLLAAGATRYAAIANVVRLLVLATGLYLTIHVFQTGLPGAIWVLVFAPVLAYAALMPGLARHIRGMMLLEGVTFLVFVGCTTVAAALWLLVSGMIPRGMLG
jgi:O-antigen/teichoic acid export membrane protein